ncbi:methionyl-tRNA formyltransferase [Deferribacter desulfuricans SSM1]|uniref:Methionyl-tRNA formyltransferase n=1 Tax=Deferribacter desulfuricans (strain DSM 14783 / JCM 11476 / NBRC 101012 / SSM1) TaxID=639282 RepID=D3P9Q5_DEFDS|nr:methionyl-tRNA formyltransferase [Deferribacter desulfuricans]BAI81445.1 methionyl-tRNA formyltransferase [Deferribacter desulfuricans SSM1]
MNVVFMGTPEIAVPTLKELIDNDINVSLVVCQPDKPKGRGKKLTPPPVKEFALQHNLEVYQPDKIKNNQEAYDKIKFCNPDFLVVVAYGKILPKEILDVPKKGPINVHFSLLPKYRGAAPVNWAIINGEEKTGVTTMLMDTGLDTGDILLKEETFVDKKTAPELLDELSITGAKLLIKTLTNFDDITPIKQDDEQATYAPILKKEDGIINFDEDATIIERKIRGLQPWPSAYTYLNGKILKIFEADVVKDNTEVEPGTIFDITKKNFKVKCKSDALVIKELQFEGKKRMNTAAFLSGYKLENGLKLGKNS